MGYDHCHAVIRADRGFYRKVSPAMRVRRRIKRRGVEHALAVTYDLNSLAELTRAGY